MIVFDQVWQDVLAAFLIAVGTGGGVVAGRALMRRAGRAVKAVNQAAQAAVISGVVDRIDEKFGTQIEGTYGAVNSGRMNRIEDDVTHIRSDITVLDGGMVALETKIERVETTVANLDGKVDELDSKFDGLALAVSAIGGKVDVLVARD